jgi:hypothetical protein
MYDLERLKAHIAHEWDGTDVPETITGPSNDLPEITFTAQQLPNGWYSAVLVYRCHRHPEQCDYRFISGETLTETIRLMEQHLQLIRGDK